MKTEVKNEVSNQSPFFEEEKQRFRDSIPEIEEKNNVKVLMAFVRGSHMYGTSTFNSDVDITFVYQQPTEEILKGNYKEQLSIGGNDIVGYEIERFLNLLGQNNPNILEALDIPEDCMIFKSEDMIDLKQEDWLSKLTENTILGYAESQIKKATGLNKKMNTPQPKERKSILEFCYIIENGNTIPFLTFFEKYKVFEDCDADYNKWGLVKMENGKQLYALYPNFKDEVFRGLVKDDSVNLRMSDVPKRNERISYVLIYNLDGFEVHCKQWKQYWEWDKEKNEERFNTNQDHGKKYDSKNMMHLFRLLDMAFHIAFNGKLHTRSKDVEWLKEIRRGEIEYETLMEDSEQLKGQISMLYEMSDLPDRPDNEKKKDLILQYRMKSLEKEEESELSKLLKTKDSDKKDYNSIMKVVDEIESISSTYHGGFNVVITGDACQIISKSRSKQNAYIHTEYGDKLASTYKACLKFAEWYLKK